MVVNEGVLNQLNLEEELSSLPVGGKVTPLPLFTVEPVPTLSPPSAGGLGVAGLENQKVFI